jgi:hypothetical protein
MNRMLFALLICTDDGCDVEYEALGLPDELAHLCCEFCGCTLQAVSWAEAAPNGAAPQRMHVQLLDAA